MCLIPSRRRPPGSETSGPISMANIGIDIGGTFTDFTVVRDDGTAVLWKEESDPQDPTRPIAAGLTRLADRLGVTVEALVGDASSVVHGSTVATNTVIQRNGPLVGLLCTEGFRDILYFRDGFKPERFNIRLRLPPPLVDRYLCLAVAGRVDRDGHVVTPLNERHVREAAARFREAGVAAVAVSFLWSIVNPEHEQRAAEILRAELPDIHVVCSASVLPEIREWERTSATVLSAYVLPRVDSYLRRLEELLEASGHRRDVLVMQNNGGCASVTEILRQPVNMLSSGPAAAPAAAAALAREVRIENLIIIDMGGTSSDISLLKNARAKMSRVLQVEGQPLGVPGVDVHSIGAGGGSIAWVDAGGALRVGPRSAGARPGPASYGYGGEEPTVTDANVMLGYLDPLAFLGGRRPLRRDLAYTAIEHHIADRLGLNVLDAAAGIIRVVNANMMRGIQSISIERGLDPREYTLVGAGGAGGLHAAQLARELRMKEVLIPREASTFCAYGMTVTDVRHDYVHSLHAATSNLDVDRLEHILRELESRAGERLRSEGFATESMIMERTVDARYPGQVHELTVPVPDRIDLAAGPLIEATFHEEHEAQFTYARPDLPVELLHWRVTAIGRREPAKVLPATPEPHRTEEVHAAGDARLADRDVYHQELGRAVRTAVYALEGLAAGATLEGPAVVQGETTTVVVGPRERLLVLSNGSLLIELDNEAVADANRPQY